MDNPAVCPVGSRHSCIVIGFSRYLSDPPEHFVGNFLYLDIPESLERVLPLFLS